MNNYKTLDLAKTRIPDCLVKYNKIGKGSGEARLYLGGEGLRDWRDFLGNFQLKCFFDRKGLMDYLQSVEFEYKNPSQGYRSDIKGYWQKYVQELEQLPAIIYFSIFLNKDTSRVDSRFYIKSTDKIYDYFRKIALPNISSLLIQKILIDGEIQLWFRLYLNDMGHELDREIADENVVQIEESTDISETEKETIIKARKGQGNYRDLIIKKYKSCIITGIDDERMLIASHIKPWVSSNNSERICQQNGLLLSPTFDKLFDRGFISFRDSGIIMLSNHFSDDNFARTRLQGTKFNIRFTSEMIPFLDFHRDTIFMR